MKIKKFKIKDEEKERKKQFLLQITLMYLISILTSVVISILSIQYYIVSQNLVKQVPQNNVNINTSVEKNTEIQNTENTIVNNKTINDIVNVEAPTIKIKEKIPIVEQPIKTKIESISKDNSNKDNNKKIKNEKN